MKKPTLSKPDRSRSGVERVGFWSFNEDRVRCDSALPGEPGVYAFSIDGQVMYVGLASGAVAKRLYFYGNPGPKQPTNIRVNDLIRQAAKEDRTVKIHVARPPDTNWNGLPVSGPEGLEAGIIKNFELPWNMRGSIKAKTLNINASSASHGSLYDRCMTLYVSDLG